MAAGSPTMQRRARCCRYGRALRTSSSEAIRQPSFLPPMPRAAAASVSPLTCRDTRCACQRRRRVNRDARWACAVALDIWARPPVHMRQRAHIHAPSNGEQTPRPREGRHAERATRPRMGAATRRDASRRAARAPPLCPGQAAARCPYAGRITATLPTFGRYSFNIKRKC